METISLKMEQELLNEIDSTLKIYRYGTRTEFIRDAIRTKLTELEKDRAIKNLADLKGSFKSKMSEKEASKLSSKEIAKKLGIKLNLIFLLFSF